MATISKISAFEAPKFSHSFLLFFLLGSACGLASGRGSLGRTPLLLAAMHSHDLVVQRLLEAKAAVDTKDNEGRGLGRGFGGKPLESMGSL